MNVIKRNGEKEEIKLDKITRRVVKMSEGLTHIDPLKVAIKVVQGLFDGVRSEQIDNELAETSASMVTQHHDYSNLASNIAISNLHKNTKSKFSLAMFELYNHTDAETGESAPIISGELYDIVNNNRAKIDKYIDHSRDYTYDYFGFKTLEKSYLQKINGKVVERPQYLVMRVALGIYGTNFERAFQLYDDMSLKLFTHATPTLFNAGTPTPQLSSCFLIQTKEDSIEGIFDTLKQTAKISQTAGGIGLSIHNVRASGSYIKGTNGKSDGIIPMLKVYNETARYVNQGGKRKGSFAIYLEPWHADIFDFLDLRKNTGKEEMRARDLFLALWINDEFMRRVESDSTWSLMCPNVSKGLSDVYGDEFDTLYKKYESEGKFVKQIKARELWDKILVAQIETGNPYMLYKDSVNRKSNQKNLGTIKSSNLCTEIVEYTSPEEVAVCNLASISLPKFVINGEFDHKKLLALVKRVTRNLNTVIDVNYYPVKEAKNSNTKHRPIGLGVQGLADVFMMLGLPYESDKAKQLNIEIFETIYYGTMFESNQLAIEDGHYESFEGSPLSKGRFQFDLWNNNKLLDGNDKIFSGRYPWEKLRDLILIHGVRNSLTVAPMPTASTSQILGNTEAFEPLTSNMYTRRTLSGEHIVINKHLVNDLVKLGLWNSSISQMIKNDKGSVQNLPIPTELKEVYKTVWEMKMRNIIDMSADRGVFIDQSQSLNLYVQDVTKQKLNAIHMYGWKKGLKTGMYYLRTKSAVDAKGFKEDESMTTAQFQAMIKKSRESQAESEDCDMCGS